MGEYKHELLMTNPKTGNQDAYYFDHSILDELACISDFWIPAGFTDFWIDGISIELPPFDQKEAE